MSIKNISSFFFFIFLTCVQSSILPVEYEIVIEPNLSELSFEGEVTLTVVVEEISVKNVTLNTKNLIIENDSVIVHDSSSEEINVTSVSQDQNGDLIIELEEELESGQYFIEIKYSGKINEEQEGLYVGKYTKENDTERPFALTNFHYDKARQVFPCFDDPTKPSTFILHIIRPNDYKAVSNMAKTGEESIDNDTIKDTFAKTDLIPTYMLSFAIIDFDEESFGESVSVYSLDKNNTQFLGELSAEVVTKFQEIENVKLTNVYQIVVPDSTLPKNVIVNVGLILYRHSSVFYQSDRESLQEKQEIAKLITGSIVRQWYKNIDSFKWWPNYWITEGITTTYQYDVLDSLYPEWRIKEQFIVEELDEALGLDEGSDEMSIILDEDDTPDTYTKYQSTKAYAFVRMFMNLPQPGDILEDDDNAIALSWTQNTGYPVLTVTRNRDTNIFNFTQNGNQIRQIPISIVFEDQTEQVNNFILDSSTMNNSFSTLLNGSWYIVNVDRTGYYRTNYDSVNWDSITNFLVDFQNDIDQIPSSDRGVLISDASFLAAEGQLSYSNYLNLLSYLKKEEDYIPILAFLRNANRLKVLLANTDTQNLFIRYARGLVEHLYKVGIAINPSESHLDTLKRIQILPWLCSFNHQQCQSEMFQILSHIRESQHPDLQEAIYCGGMRLSGWDNLNFLQSEHVIHKKKRVLKSMACTSDADILWHYLSALIGESILIHLESEDKVDAFLSIIDGSDVGVQMAIDYVKQHLETFLTTFTYEEIFEMFTALSKKLVTEEQSAKVDEIHACLTEAQNVTFGSLLQIMRDNTNRNLRWREAYVDDIHEWLAKNVVPATTTTTTATATNITTTTPEPSTTPSKAVEIFKISSLSIFIYLLLHVFVN